METCRSIWLAKEAIVCVWGGEMGRKATFLASHKKGQHRQLNLLSLMQMANRDELRKDRPSGHS